MHTINLLPWREKKARNNLLRRVMLALFLQFILLLIGVYKTYVMFDQLEHLQRQRKIALMHDQVFQLQRQQVTELTNNLQHLQQYRQQYVLPYLRQRQLLLRLSLLLEKWPAKFNLITLKIDSFKIVLQGKSVTQHDFSLLVGRLAGLPGFVAIRDFSYARQDSNGKESQVVADFTGEFTLEAQYEGI